MTEQWLERARRRYGAKIEPVEIRFDLRGLAAGQYRNHPVPLIRFNAELASRQFEAFCRLTPPHEVAHHVVDQLQGPGNVRPHGREWQAVMREFGLEPSRCHDFDIRSASIRRQRRFRYRCACRTQELSATRHNRILRGERYYFCRVCGERLQAED
ncbi:MAG TPA: hypothetical protein EYP90_02330 [Chromatiaceae bacterium]|nr:hypothetical protein [Chromatiaceae bacterium]